MFSDLSRQHPQDVDLLYCLAFLAHRNGDLAATADYFERALELDPDDIEIRTNFCNILLDFRDYRKLLPHAKHLLRIDPGSPDAYAALCHVYDNKGQPEVVRNYLKSSQKKARHGIDFHCAKILHLSEEHDRYLRAVDRGRCAIPRPRHGEPRAATWMPEVEGERDVLLRGVTEGTSADAVVAFAITTSADAGVCHRIVPATMEASWTTAANGIVHWVARIDDLDPGKTYRCELRASDADTVFKGDPMTFATGRFAEATVETLHASPNGTTGALVNGRVGGTTLPTIVHFEYGEDAETLESRTPGRPLPPPRTARTADVVTRALDRMMCYAVEWDALEAGSTAWREAELALRLRAPFASDRNHIDGVGPIELFLGWRSVLPGHGYATGAASEAIDLRDARIGVGLRTSRLDAKQYLLAVAVNTAVEFDPLGSPTAAAVWVLTGQMVDPWTLGEDRWQRLEFDLPANSEQWTFAGNNVTEQGARADRYRYVPLSAALSKHRGNLCFLFLFGDERDTPEGAVDLVELSLSYRDWSLLGPHAGARLVAWPRDSFVDPARLSGGCKGDPAEYWFSAPEPEAPQEFAWELADEARLRRISVYQNTLTPARDVEILVSTDGDAFEPAWRTTLDDGRHGDTTSVCASVDLGVPVGARFVKLRILSGHDSDFWGLDGIEVFGDGPAPRPETDPCHLAEEIEALTPGTTVFYRLVTENAAGRVQGAIRSVTLPADRRPVIHSAKVLRRRPDGVTLLVRMTAMGLESELSGVASDSRGGLFDGVPLAAGSESTPRHITYVLSGLEADEPYRATLTARNDGGASDRFEIEFRTVA